MKRILFTLLLLSSICINAQLSWQGGTTPEETSLATLLFDATGTSLESYSGTIYAHTGVTINDTNDWQNVIGDWGNNGNQPALTLVSGNVYSLDLTPTIQDFYSNPSGTITAIDIVLRSDDSGSQTSDLNIPVGAFQVSMINPQDSANGVIVVANGGGTQILATNSNGNANYELFANGVSIHTQNNTSFYNGYLFTGLTENQYCDLVVTQGASSITKTFVILVNNTVNQTMAVGLEEGINYNSGDATKATLVLSAPLKDFVYVAGSFNNWKPTASDAMKYDTASQKYWMELTGLTSGTIYTFQYWVADQSTIANSPALVKTADPYSTLVLSPFDDSGIPAASYPSLPAYPTGQEREVTVLQTNQTNYSWVVPNFSKPKKEDLIIYEVLIRDFDANRNFQDLIDRIDYFKSLNINAIELMPVMEFEGNESWGYNTAYHMALDKFYGTENKFKEFIDLCHQNGIAVILDIALNHATGRNPLVRMWMDDADNDGWGEPSSESPYFNQTATHSYSVFNDFNHQKLGTQNYVQRVVKHWVENFKIDGFRWDLTKGFTQNCTDSNQSCTNSYQQDRVDILKQYADYSWSLDPDHYVIFEHLGTAAEEQQWADYRIGEGKGVMLWGKMTDPYSQLTMGYNSSNDLSGMGHSSRGFTGKRLVGYAESHDEERLMYKNLQFGNSSNGSHDVKDLNTALSRMDALAAVSLSIPGPKMIWHFAELGMENSIFTCNNGSVNDPDCKLDTKPQSQWANNWPSDTNRSVVFDAYARLIDLKVNEPVFEGDYSITTNTLQPKIYVWDNSIPVSQLKNVVILANFDVTAQNVTPDFPYTGTWYDLMDETGSTSINVTNTANPINIPAGEFRIYGNKAATLSTEDVILDEAFTLFPNPTTTSFSINKAIGKVTIYNITGKKILTYTDNFQPSYSFDVSKLSNGIYLVKFETNSSSITKKLIIN